MKYVVRIAPDAEQAILEQAEYIAQDKPAAAESWLAALYGAIDELETLPRRHPAADDLSRALPARRHDRNFWTRIGTAREALCAARDEPRVAAEELVQRPRGRQVARIVGVALLPPVGWMRPDEVEALVAKALVRRGISGVEAGPQVAREARNAKFAAYIGGGAAAGHGVEHVARPEVLQ